VSGTTDARLLPAMGRRRIRSAAVTETQITLRILRRGPRADELLAHVARRFGPDRVRRDDFDAVKIRVSARASMAWDDVRVMRLMAPAATGGNGCTSHRAHSADAPDFAQAALMGTGVHALSSIR
jgi:hypothetical protein